MKLVTSTGQVKESSECAPNGYYLIPIYETKGSYRLQVQGPNGWNFGKIASKITIIMRSHI